ncbi:class I lanthipeptide [Pontimicrobium sp. MEBiC06410]
MKTQLKKTLDFTKLSITELHETQIGEIKGGTLTPGGGISCSFCISSSNGGNPTVEISITAAINEQ